MLCNIKYTIWKQMQQIESLYFKELKYVTSLTDNKDKTTQLFC